MRPRPCRAGNGPLPWSPADAPDLPTWIGVDASVKRDSTALVAVTWSAKDQQVRLVNHTIITPTADRPVDFEATIEQVLLDWHQRYNVRGIFYDPYQMVSSSQRLTADAAPPAGVTAAEWARHQMIQDQASAWQPRDADLPNTGASTRATASVPPVGAYCQAGFGAKAGDQCMADGSGGRLVERGGWLFCEVPTRSGTSSGDSMSAADGEALKAAAWNEMVADLTSAWKTPA